jgi:hypothetical protein
MNERYLPVLAILFASLLVGSVFAATGYWYWAGGALYGPDTSCANSPNPNNERNGYFSMPNIIGTTDYYGFISWHNAISGYQDCQVMITFADLISTSWSGSSMLAEMWWRQDTGTLHFGWATLTTSPPQFAYAQINLSPPTQLSAFSILVYYQNSQIIYQFWTGVGSTSYLRYQATTGIGGFVMMNPIQMSVGEYPGTYGGSGYWNGVQANYY